MAEIKFSINIKTSINKLSNYIKTSLMLKFPKISKIYVI